MIGVSLVENGVAHTQRVSGDGTAVGEGETRTRDSPGNSDPADERGECAIARHAELCPERIIRREKDLTIRGHRRSVYRQRDTGNAGWKCNTPGWCCAADCRRCRA